MHFSISPAYAVKQAARKHPSPLILSVVEESIQSARAQTVTQSMGFFSPSCLHKEQVTSHLLVKQLTPCHGHKGGMVQFFASLTCLLSEPVCVQ